VLLTVTAIGYANYRVVVAATAATQDVVLRTASETLAPVRITGRKGIRAEPKRSLEPGIGAVDFAASGAASNLAPASFAGNVLGAAELQAGLALARNASGQVEGVSVMGLPSDQSSVMLDGVLSPSPRLPRDADVAVRLSTSSYDPSRGGFSGGQVELTTEPGSNISWPYLDLSQSSQLLARPPVGVSDISGGASGALSLDHVFYSASAELSEERAALSSFTNQRISPLSASDVASLGRVLDSLGLTPRNVSRTQLTRSGVALGRLDFVRDSNLSVALEAHGSTEGIEPNAYGPLLTPGVFGHDHDGDAGLSATVTHHVGNALNQSRIGVGMSTETTLPYVQVPTLDVRVLASSGTLDDRRSLLAGSALDRATSLDRFTATLEHSVRWIPSSRHTMEAGFTSHYSRMRRMAQSNSLGTFSFDSVGALAVGRPASYARTFDPVDQKAQTGSLAGYFGDVWTPRPRMSIELGGRVDANRAMIPMTAFEASTSASTLAPSTSTRATSVDVSPRLGVTIDRAMAKKSSIAGVTFRAGVGRFVNDARPETFLNASIPVTGPLAVSELSCAGTAAPPLISDGSSGYTTCLDGVGASPLRRTGYLLASDWKPASTWRGNAGMSVQLRNQLTLSADYIVSRTGRISSVAPLNLTDSPVFVVPLEQDRPVFAAPDTVAANAAFATGTPRLNDPSLGRVAEVVSDLHSRSRQLLLGAQYWTFSGLQTMGQYALTQANDEARGLASAAGDPRSLEWGPAGLASTHAFTLEVFRQVGRRLSLSLTGRVQSGIRYTPTVAGDINGDGFNNDRPYIFDPATTGDSALRAGLGELLTSAPGAARKCLQRAIGSIIGRNSCEGPWIAHFDGQLRVYLGSGSARNRSALRLDVINLAAAADRLVHGPSGLHGWGGFGIPDELLYTVAGFDPETRTYHYQVNPSFGSSRATAAFNNPFTIRVSIIVPLGRDPAAQQLIIDATRRVHPTVEQLVDRYATEYPNAALDLINVADSIGLRPAQLDSLRTLARSFDGIMRTIWTPVARAISEHPKDVVVQAHRIEAARTPAAINYEAYRKMVIAVLDPNQMARLPVGPRLDLGDNALRAMGLIPY
jgi:hypothetical protein